MINSDTALISASILRIRNIQLALLALLIVNLIGVDATAEPERMESLNGGYGFGNTISIGVWTGDIKIDGEPYIYSLPIKVLDAKSSEIDIQKCGEEAKLFERIDGIFEFDTGTEIETIEVKNQKSITLFCWFDFTSKFFENICDVFGDIP